MNNNLKRDIRSWLKAIILPGNFFEILTAIIVWACIANIILQLILDKSYSWIVFIITLSIQLVGIIGQFSYTKGYTEHMKNFIVSYITFENYVDNLRKELNNLKNEKSEEIKNDKKI